MDDSVNNDKILARVRKLLTLSNDDAATEGERDNALRMALNTLTKYAMTMEDVSEHEREKVDPRGEYSNEGFNTPWTRQVRASVARLFMCSYYYMRINSTRAKHSFVGRESNATTAMYMSEWIVKGLLREADQRYGHRLTPEGRSFGEGASQKLSSRVYEMQRAQQGELKAAGSALVVLDMGKAEKNANDAWIAEHVGALRTSKGRSSSVNLDAYRSGQSHAAGISLNTQVTNTKRTLKLK